MNFKGVRFFDLSVAGFARKACCHGTLLTSIAVAPIALVALAIADSKDREATLSQRFRCPEEYPSDAAKKSALRDFMQNYSVQFPDNNVRT
jgi:hypothetical protein